MPWLPSRDFPEHQESNWCLRCLLHCRQILWPLSHLGSPFKKLSNAKNGEGNGNWLQYCHLENSMDRGAWQATVHGVTKSWTRLNWLSTHQHTFLQFFNFCMIASSCAESPTSYMPFFLPYLYFLPLLCLGLMYCRTYIAETFVS